MLSLYLFEKSIFLFEFDNQCNLKKHFEQIVRLEIMTDVTELIDPTNDINTLLDQFESRRRYKNIQLKFGYESAMFYDLVLNDSDELSENQKILKLEQLIIDPSFDLKYEVYLAIYMDRLDVLKWLASNGFNICQTDGVVNYLSSVGNVRILQWMLENDLIKTYDNYAINVAFHNDFIDCLNWWTNSGLELKHSSSSWHIARNEINCIKWLLKNEFSIDIRQFLIGVVGVTDAISKLELICDYCQAKEIDIEYDEDFIDEASMTGDIEIMEWWMKRGFEIIYTADAFEGACSDSNGYNVIKWWLESRLPLKYDKNRLINTIIQYSKVPIMILLLNNGLCTLDDVAQYDSRSVDCICICGHTQMLDWLWQSRIEIKYSDETINTASREGRTDILDWFLNHGFEFKYTAKAFDKAMDYGKINVLDWWLRHRDILELKYTTPDCLNLASRSGKFLEILQWWHKNGLAWPAG